MQCISKLRIYYIFAAKRNNLVKYTLRIPHGTVTFFGNSNKRFLINQNPFFTGDKFNLLFDVFNFHSSKIESLASACYCCQDFMNFSCCKHKQQMRWWFLQCFEKCVKCSIREHVHFINNIHFIFTCRRRIFCIFPEFTYIINGIV